jgi:hypothetical protein
VLRREATRRLRNGDAAAALLVSAEALAESRKLVESEPGQPSRRFDLLNALLTHAAALQQAKPGDAAPLEDLLAQAEAEYAQLEARGVATPLARTALGSVLGNHARWLMALAPPTLRDLPRSQALLVRAEALQREALAKAPRCEPARAALWAHLRLHTAVALAMRQGDEAMATLDASAALARNAEEALAVVDTLVRTSAIERALDQLAAFRKRGLVTESHLRGDPRLAALRGHARFPAILRGEDR